MQKNWNTYIAALVLFLVVFVIALVTGQRKNPKMVVTQSRYRDLWPFILAMAKHETANFTSNVYKTNNNAFGMNVPSKRPFIGTKGTPTPEGANYAKYKTVADSFSDLLLYFEYTNFPDDVTTAEQFVNALQRRKYFTDSQSNYLQGLKSWLK